MDFQEQFEGLARVPGLGRLHLSWTANDQACVHLFLGDFFLSQEACARAQGGSREDWQETKLPVI